MDPQQIFCHNPACPARGKVGKGNIGVHSRKQHRYICHECKTTFTQSKGTCSTAFAIRVTLSRRSSRYWLMAVRFRRLLLRLA